MFSFHSKSNHLARLLVLLDIALLSLTYTVVLRIYPLVSVEPNIDILAHLGLFPVILVIFLLSRRYSGGVSALQTGSIKMQSWCLIKETTITFAITAALIFLLKLTYVSRAVLLGFAASGTVVLIAVRAFVIWWYFSRSKEKQENYLNVLIIGSGRRAHQLADILQRTLEWGVNIVGFLDPLGESAGRRSSDNILGHVDQIGEVLRDSVIEEVIVAVPRSMLGGVQSIIDACQEEGVKLRFMADIYDFNAARIRLTMVDNIPLLSFEPVARGENALIAKRLFDLVAIILLVPVLLPFLAIVAIAIRLDSPGPALFVQDRVGLHKRRFRLYKFRSMVVDAEARMQDIEHLNEADGPNFKVKNDPRMTRLGRLLRRTSIDELPQLINVFLGDMSLVGPRPMALRDVELFDKGIQRKRFSVRPGITGLWQVSGRSDLSFDKWVELDLDYIDHWSLIWDFKILLKTIPAVLKGSGAV
ncbi:MAG: sugar transferase [Gammaproteobacteria bacterium]|nr:sugar transferase [Gammaproteobacteria bacterium]